MLARGKEGSALGGRTLAYHEQAWDLGLKPLIGGQSHKNNLTVALIVAGQMVRGNSKSLTPH